MSHGQSFREAEFAARFGADAVDCATPVPPESWLQRSADARPPAAAGWEGADAERRKLKAHSSARASVASPGAEGALSLDYRTYVSPTPESAGEWHVQATVVDDYCEYVAVEDVDHSLGRGGKGAATATDRVVEVAESKRILEDDIDDMDERFRKNEKAARRAKRDLKWKVLVLRADRIWTLTTRGGIASLDEAWALWGEFERYCSRRFAAFKVVVVMERHKSGTWHIHFVTNRFFDVNSMRLWWHRILTSTYVDSEGVTRPNAHRIKAPLRGDASPGNIDVQPPKKTRKLAGYLGKYLGKGFEALWTKRIKRYASSKGIGEPTRTRRRMHALMGEHVYRLRSIAQEAGWQVLGVFEGSVAGRRLVWMQCKRVRRRVAHPS